MIEWVAGYGTSPADIPERYRHAVRLLAGHWYEFREPVSGSGAQPKEIPLGISALLALDAVEWVGFGQ